jgi:hypothetical protein
MIPDAPPRLARYVGERVQVRCGWQERPAVGIVTDEDEIGITIETSDTERLYPWTAITSVRRARA